MALYRYKAKQGPNNIIEGTVEADTQDAAVNKITQQGLFPFSVEKAATEKKVPKFLDPLAPLLKKSPVKLKDREEFTRQLSDLLHGGLPLFQALDLLSQETENSSMKEVIESLKSQVKEGVALSKAMSYYPKLFPPLYTNMVHAGEVGGVLDKVLNRLAEFAEKEQETKSKVKTALAYPIFLMVVGAITVLVLLLFVIPKLTPVFDDFGQTLPLPTLFIVGLSHLILQYWWALALLIIGLIVFIKQRNFIFGSNVLLDRLVLNVPVVGPLIKKREISRFTRTLTTLLSNGIPILTSLKIVEENLHNSLFKQEVLKMEEAVTEGRKLGDSLKGSTLFPLSVSHMMSVGEETGNFESTLENIADNYDREVDRATKVFTTLLEPLMILILGGIIAVIVIAMLLPIFNLQMGVG